MQQEADLILWLAGNQFVAMDKVVAAFQARDPDARVVGLITLPPGLLVRAAVAGGWRYQGLAVPGRPDVLGSVDVSHLSEVRRAGLMDSFLVYLHNEMQLMVARGNPRGIAGIADLVRPGLRVALPNPLTEGIMRFYGKPVLERHGLWHRLTAGAECSGCQATPTTWLTSVHHREIPERIMAGRADVGLVWRTETLAAQEAGAAVEGVRLPPEDSGRDLVWYVAGAMRSSARASMARRYLEFLATREAQEAYASFGFVPATAGDLKLRPIP
jgi:ABC-type molybdate transport system substrate-binding protein